MVMKLNEHERATSTVTLNDEQFHILVDLLTPGYEVAKLYLADYHRTNTPTEPVAKKESHEEHSDVDAAAQNQGDLNSV